MGDTGIGTGKWREQTKPHAKTLIDYGTKALPVIPYRGLRST